MVCASCATASSQRAPNASKGFVRLEVTPKHAGVYVDEQYQGEVQGWMHQTIAVTPGRRRLALKSEGYMTQRFDVDVAQGEVVTLSLRMERELDVIAPPKKSGRNRKR